MLRLNCDSSPPFSPSPSPLSSSQTTFQRGYGNNGQLFSDQSAALNLSPRPPSYNLNPAVTFGKILPDQSSVWSESEMTPCLTSFSCIASNGTPNSKSSVELMKEITSLEVEIFRLERYLLSLYRTAFEEHLHCAGNNETPLHYKIESNILPISDQSCHKVETDAWLNGYHGNISSSRQGIDGSQDHISSAISNSSSGKERKAAKHGHRSLGEFLGTPSNEKAILDEPDRLSEDIVRCISSIYCKLGEPNQSHTGLSVSSTSSLSSSSTFSTRNFSDTWSPYCNEEATKDNKYESLKEDRGPYAEMIEVLKIGLDDDSFNYAARMLKHFRTLIKKLESVDLGKLKREQKLAFWINIHNALVMHAYLAYGTHNNSKSSSIFKATYNVGGHGINAYIIQSSILGIRPHFRAPWLQSLISPGRKLKTGPNKHVYAIEYPEPLVHFALCLGAFSDPAVRIYKAKNVFQDLRLAKEEFIQSTVYIHKETRIYLPKILYFFAKDMALTMPGLLEIVKACLSESQQKAIKRSVKGKPDKHVYWLSQSSIFRYVIHRDAVEGRLSV